MSACLLCLRGMCLYILIYLLQCRIQMVNYYLTACLDFKPFLLAPCQKLTNLPSSSSEFWTIDGTGRCTQTQRYKARDSVTRTCVHECQLFVLNAQGATWVRKASSVWRMNFGSLLSSKEHRYTFNHSICKLVCSENMNMIDMLLQKLKCFKMTTQRHTVFHRLLTGLTEVSKLNNLIKNSVWLEHLSSIKHEQNLIF